MSFNLRKLVRNKRRLDAIDSKELANLRNRLEASQKSPHYNERTHVDVPSDLLERMLTALEGVVKP